MIAFFILVSVIVTFIYLIFLRYCSGVITWAIIFAYHIVLAATALFFYQDSEGKLDASESTSYTNSMTS